MTKGQKVVLVIGAATLLTILVVCAISRPDAKVDAPAFTKSYEYETQAVIYAIAGIALFYFSFRKPKPKPDNPN
jgi:Mn2+/Fe2+ NRAMP family transporter